MIELRRGDVVLLGEWGDYTGKPRPGVIVQHQATLAVAPSVTLCGMTSVVIPTNVARIAIAPSADNGLDVLSFVMIDKIASIRRDRIRQVLGRLSANEVAAVDAALRRWLEL